MDMPEYSHVTHTCRYPWKPEKCVTSPGARVPGGCEITIVGAGN